MVINESHDAFLFSNMDIFYRDVVYKKLFHTTTATNANNSQNTIVPCIFALTVAMATSLNMFTSKLHSAMIIHRKPTVF